MRNALFFLIITHLYLMLMNSDRIYDLWDGSLDKRKVRGVVPWCGQDGYQAQIPRYAIDSYRYISHI